MRRYFNTEGICEPNIHYMVRLDERIRQIKERYIDKGSYFVINKGRQYGKTTTLRALDGFLASQYMTASLDFQMMSSTNFESELSFSKTFAKIFADALWDKTSESEKEVLAKMQDAASGQHFSMNVLFDHISLFCKAASKPVVLIIDEVDSASNNQVFLDFLALLRGYYLDRNHKPIFQSVILAGVYDIKNLKLKIRSEEEHRYNSPWNIAAKFRIPMSFKTEQIAGMLQEYEADNGTGMDIEKVAACLYEYTGGYPYLVSALCKIMDEELPEAEDVRVGGPIWSRAGIEMAVRHLLMERTSLFDSLAKQMDAYSDLKIILEEIIYQGKHIPYGLGIKSIDMGIMFGFLKEEGGRVVIANRIFEMGLLNMFIAEEALNSDAFLQGQRDKNQFIRGGRLDMERVLEKFVEHFSDVFSDNDESFVEKYGRKFFLLYLKPIINGTGNYYIEASTRDAGRTDVIVDYRGEQFIIEMKIWHGSEYNQRGEAQLIEYLKSYRLDKGYMISFNFNQKKQAGVMTFQIGEKTIVEAVV